MELNRLIIPPLRRRGIVVPAGGRRAGVVCGKNGRPESLRRPMLPLSTRWRPLLETFAESFSFGFPRRFASLPCVNQGRHVPTVAEMRLLIRWFRRLQSVGAELASGVPGHPRTPVAAATASRSGGGRARPVSISMFMRRRDHLVLPIRVGNRLVPAIRERVLPKRRGGRSDPG